MSLLETDLPPDRQWIRIGDAYQVTRKPRKLALPALVPFVPMERLPQGGGYDFAFEMRPSERLTSGTYFEHGDVLVAKITPSFENGKRALASNFPYEFGYATTEIIPLKAIGDRDPRFLFYYLLHPDVSAFVAEKMEGATGRQRVPEHVLLDLAFPDVAEESAIADVLELVRHAVDAEIACLEHANKLKTATMHELFTRGLRGEAQKESEIGLIPETWSVIELGGLGRVGNGSTPKRGHAPYWEGGHYPWLTSAKVYDRDVIAADQFVTGVALEECHLPRVRPGSILMAITGQGKTLGHCAVLKIEATVNQHIAYVSIEDQEAANPSFVRGFLETQYEYLRQVGSGGGSTKGALTCGFLRSMKVPMPPDNDRGRAEQLEIVAVLDAIDTKIAVHGKKRDALEALFKSLLHKLMSGEIRVSDLDLSVLSKQSKDTV